MLRTAFRLASLVSALMLLTTSVAIAAPVGNKSSSSSLISLVTTTPAASAAASSGSPAYGTSVTFAASTDATTQPFVHLRCFQNGTLVLESWQAWAYSDHMFMLGGSPGWKDGVGDCTAYLENSRRWRRRRTGASSMRTRLAR